MWPVLAYYSKAMAADAPARSPGRPRRAAGALLPESVNFNQGHGAGADMAHLPDGLLVNILSAKSASFKAVFGVVGFTGRLQADPRYLVGQSLYS